MNFLYLFIQKSEPKNFILISQLLKYIKLSDLYINSTKEEKRKITIKSIVRYIMTNEIIKNNFKEIYRPSINGIQKRYSNILLGHKFVEGEI